MAGELPEGASALVEGTAGAVQVPGVTGGIEVGEALSGRSGVVAIERAANHRAVTIARQRFLSHVIGLA
jgi:hypothetical protein